MKLDFNPRNSTWYFIHEILQQARTIDKEELVAKHLVGIQLSFQFPHRSFPGAFYPKIGSVKPGDFSVNNAVIYVCVNPTLALYNECNTAVTQGYRAYLLVPTRMLVGCRQNAESVAPRRITVLAIEDFASQNIDDWLAHSDGDLIGGFRRLLEVYNQRVDSVETDKSMLIEIPKNLQD